MELVSKRCHYESRVRVTPKFTLENIVDETVTLLRVRHSHAAAADTARRHPALAGHKPA